MSTTTTAVNAAAVSRVLSNANVLKSRNGVNRSRRGYTMATASMGFTVSRKADGTVIADYRMRTWSDYSREVQLAKRNEGLAKITEVLTAKGYTVTAVEHIYEGQPTGITSYLLITK